MSERSAEEIREDIESTREELGETVEELAAKTDVKGRAQAKAEDVKAQATERSREGMDAVKRNPVPIGIAAAVVVLVAIRWVSRR